MNTTPIHPGDHGQTHTLAGTLIFKNDLRAVVPGTVDELVTHLSMVKLKLQEQRKSPVCSPETDGICSILTWIQTCCFIIAARASDPYCESSFQRQITEHEVNFLTQLSEQEKQKAAMPRSFIIPGANENSCLFDIARILARNLERGYIDLAQQFSGHQIAAPTFAFINRLSDFFYVVARAFEKGKFIPIDYQLIQQIPQQYQK